MENAINLKQASIPTLTRIIASLEATGTPFNIWLEVPEKEKKPVKKFDQHVIEFPMDEQETKLRKDWAKKQANGKRGTYRKYDNLIDVVISRMDRGEKYTVGAIAKSMYKEYGVRGKAKSKFHQAVYKIVSKNTDHFEVDKTDPHLSVYSLK